MSMLTLPRARSSALGRWLCRLAAMAALAGPAAAQDSTAARTARITYLTSVSAYIDAGRDDGLEVGTAVDVLKGGAPVASLKVAYLASHQAACDIVSASGTPSVGDTVRYVPSARAARLAADTTGATPATMAARSSPKRNGSHWLRGRVGVRYLAVLPRDSIGTRLSQPSFDLRLDGFAMGGTPLGISVDVRTRRTASTRPDGTSVTDGLTRVYQAALFLNSPGGPFRVTAGRQYSPALASLTLFDGVLMEFNKAGWSAGGFGGTEPDPVSMGFSSTIRDYGGYFQLHNGPSAPAHWLVTLGGIGSYEGGIPNREFLYLQAAYSSRRFSAYATQEMDHYRADKQALGEPAFSLTSTFATLRYEIADGVSLNGGFDNRRNVRLYRDVVNPETAFDDAFRQAVWGGMSFQFSRRYRLGFDARSSTGGTVSGAQAYSAYLGADRLTSFGLSLRTRTTRYINPVLTGWLNSLTVGLDPFSRMHLELNGGLRLEQDPLAGPNNVQTSWFGADLDLTLARSWYLLVSATRESGAFDANDQIYTALTYRF
jgi:hypothetical protein